MRRGDFSSLGVCTEAGNQERAAVGRAVSDWKCKAPIYLTAERSRTATIFFFFSPLADVKMRYAHESFMLKPDPEFVNKT